MNNHQQSENKTERKQILERPFQFTDTSQPNLQLNHIFTRNTSVFQTPTLYKEESTYIGSPKGSQQKLPSNVPSFAVLVSDHSHNVAKKTHNS